MVRRGPRNDIGVFLYGSPSHHRRPARPASLRFDAEARRAADTSHALDGVRIIGEFRSGGDDLHRQLD